MLAGGLLRRTIFRSTYQCTSFTAATCMSLRRRTGHVDRRQQGSILDLRFCMMALREESSLLSVEPRQKQLILDYLDAVLEHNRHINLTAVRDREEAIKRHIDDSLALLPALEAHIDPETETQVRIIDVGSGAGFPGAVLAIAKPDWQVTLLDSLGKRCDFIRKTVSDLGISNVDVVWGRAETLGHDGMHRELYDVAIARAVAELRVLSELCLPFVKKHGFFLAAKGTKPEAEVEAAENAIKVLGGQLMGVQAVESFSEADSLPRTAVVIRKIQQTPSQFPRRAGKPLKQPL